MNTTPSRHTLQPNALLTVGGTGHMTCTQRRLDYIPPSPENVSLWVDSAEITGSGIRGAASGARAVPFNLNNRNPLVAANPHIAPALTVTLSTPSSDAQAVVRQNGANVLAFSTGAPGLSGTWGPVAAVWSMLFLVYTVR